MAVGPPGASVTPICFASSVSLLWICSAPSPSNEDATLIYRASYLMDAPQDHIRLVKHDLVNPCWIPSSFTCLEMISGISCSIKHHRDKGEGEWPVVPLVLLLLLLLQTGETSTCLQPSGISPSHHDESKIINWSHNSIIQPSWQSWIPPIRTELHMSACLCMPQPHLLPPKVCLPCFSASHWYLKYLKASLY